MYSKIEISSLRKMPKSSFSALGNYRDSNWARIWNTITIFRWKFIPRQKCQRASFEGVLVKLFVSYSIRIRSGL